MTSARAEWATKDFYAVLGVAEDADQATIKKAYRKLAKDNHPDSRPGDTAAETRFKEVAEAYDVVGDPDKRKEYDELRAVTAGGFPGGFQTGGGSYPGGFETGGAGFDLGDLFGDLFRGGSTTTGPTGARRPTRGRDLETQTSLSFTDAIEGTTIALRLSSDTACATCQGTGGNPGTRPRICPTCDGAGMVVTTAGGAFALNETCPECHGRQLIYDEACPTCHGSGRGQSNRTVRARIPAGVKNGQRIRLKGKGAPGGNGGPAGDLFVTVRVAPHEMFGRKGTNLTLVAPVRFDEAALGGEIKVPTLGGAPVTLRIPPGTPNGRVFRVRGRGAPRRDGTKGDLLVTVEVDVPDRLDDAAREALTAYREAVNGRDPRAALFTGGAS